MTELSLATRLVIVVTALALVAILPDVVDIVDIVPRAAAQGQVAIQETRADAARSLKAGAPIDLTGYWVSVVSEDWRWRMVAPDKGDFTGVPLNAEGRKVGDNWDPAKDEATGNQCKAYGAAAIMRVPGRLHITWQDDNTLKIDTDAGQQMRLLHYGPPPAKGAGTSQGVSAAVWQTPTPARGGGEGGEGGQAGGRGAGPTRGGQLKVVTTKMKGGYLRKNGAPYSDKAVMTEYFVKTKHDNGDEWLVVREPVVLLQRTTAKEQSRRLIAAEMSRRFISEHGGAVVENHLNMVRPILRWPLVPSGVATAFFNSGAADKVFRCLSGSVAVSAYELEAMPLPPPASLGELRTLVERGAPAAEVERACERLYGLVDGPF